MEISEFINLLILGVSVGAIYALVAMGLVVIYRASGVLNFAQGYLVMVGAMMVWTFAMLAGLPIVPSIVAGLASMWLIGMVLERVAVRPLLGQPILSTVGMTLGMGIFLLGLSILVWGTMGKGYPGKVFPTGMWSIGNVRLPQLQMCGLLVMLAVCGGLLLYLSRSKAGLAMQGVADDTQCARTLGVKATSMLSLTWALAAMIAGVGGFVFGNMVGIEVTVMPDIGLKAIAVMIIGGMESLTGALCGGLFVGICEYMAAGFIDPWLLSVGWGGGMKDIFPYLILVIVLLVRPYGFFGWKRIERV